MTNEQIERWREMADAPEHRPSCLCGRCGMSKHAFKLALREAANACAQLKRERDEARRVADYQRRLMSLRG